MDNTIKIGWGAPPIAEQLPQLPQAVANRLHADGDSIAHLSYRGILTPAEEAKAMKRFERFVYDALKNDRRAALYHRLGPPDRAQRRLLCEPRGTTDAIRKQRERDKRRAAGMVRLEIWVPAAAVAAVLAAIAAVLNRPQGPDDGDGE